MIDGLLVIDKPAGITSHDVVDRVRRALKTRRVGHGGTLDPDATGVLVIGVGRATRLLSYAQAGAKRYRAGARFGITTSTQDASGRVVSTSEGRVTEDQVRAALDNFAGAIEQIPPMVSAVKVGGERLYAKARRGEDIDREPRKVFVHKLDLVSFDALEQRAELDVTCSGGTYIRTLVHDLGTRLGVGAHLTNLRRVAAGGFDVTQAIDIDDVSRDALRPLVDAIGDLPRIEVGPEHAEDVAHGRRLPVELAPEVPENAEVAVVFGGDLLAIYRRAADALVADRVIPR